MFVLRIVCTVFLLFICMSAGSIVAAQEGIVHFPISGITLSPDDPDFIFDEHDLTPITPVTNFDFSIPSFISLFSNLFHISDLPIWAAEVIVLFIAIFTSGFMFFFLYNRRPLSEDPASRPMILLAYVREHPGVQQIDIITTTGFSRGSVAYNLKRLLAEHKIRKVAGDVTRYYYAGVYSSLKYNIGWKLLENPSRQLIFRLILEHPGISQNQISVTTGIPVTTLRWHLAKLRKYKVITFKKDLNVTCYTVVPSFARSFCLITNTDASDSSFPPT